MARATNVSSKSPASRGLGRKNMDTTSVGKPSTSGGKPRGRKPVTSIINDATTAYHEGIIEEIRKLI